MVKEINVEGYDAYIKAVDENKGQQILALFYGSKGANGVSWCPDCVVAEPIVTKYVKLAPENAVMIHCDVGDKVFWKDQGNIFRKDPNLLLKCVPTLLNLGTSKKLEEEQCADDSQVQQFFETQ